MVELAKCSSCNTNALHRRAYRHNHVKCKCKNQAVLKKEVNENLDINDIQRCHVSNSC